MKALIFGAGNIGRGFIGKLLIDIDGSEVIFLDVNQQLVDQLNQQGEYRIHIVADKEQIELVRHIKAVHSGSEAAIQNIASADIITTSVGPSILPKVAEEIAQGLIQRCDDQNKAFLNIIACENMIRGSTLLKEYTFNELPKQYYAWVEEHVGFVDAVVDRMVRPNASTSKEKLGITAEAFSEWIIDRTQIKGVLPPIVGIESTNNLMSFIERKLFTLNTGHTITAYLGKLAGYKTIRQAILDPQIAIDAQAAMHESGAVLIKRYGFDSQQHAAYIEKVLFRFKNPFLEDEVTRVGRQPLRKLSPNDRLIKPLLGTLQYQLPHHYLVKGVVAALLYRNEADQEAVALQNCIHQQGVKAALISFCGLENEPQIIAEITEAYAERAKEIK